MSQPDLSILIPFYRHDPCALIGELAGAAEGLGEIELIVHDDGTGLPDLTARVKTGLKAFPGEARLTASVENAGRSAARNALTGAARGRHLLFLDADMRLANENFLRRWRDEIAQAAPAICFGGFTAPGGPVPPEHRLHHAFSVSAECVPAAVRMRDPARHVFTSNLLVRRDVLEAAPFDAGFSGWGWEDMDWGARAGDRFPIRHIDNPAVHQGLESAESLLARYRESSANFGRFTARHPNIAARMPLYRWARLCKRAGWSRAFRGVLRAVASGAAPAPMRTRVLALKLWRASWYGEAL